MNAKGIPNALPRARMTLRAKLTIISTVIIIGSIIGMICVNIYAPITKPGPCKAVTVCQTTSLENQPTIPFQNQNHNATDALTYSDNHPPEKPEKEANK